MSTKEGRKGKTGKGERCGWNSAATVVRLADAAQERNGGRKEKEGRKGTGKGLDRTRHCKTITQAPAISQQHARGTNESTESSTDTTNKNRNRICVKARGKDRKKEWSR